MALPYHAFLDFNLKFAHQRLSGPHLIRTIGRYRPETKRIEIIPFTACKTWWQEWSKIHSISVFPCSQAAVFQSLLLGNGGQTWGQRVYRRTQGQRTGWTLEVGIWFPGFWKLEAWNFGNRLWGNYKLSFAKELKLSSYGLLKRHETCLT